VFSPFPCLRLPRDVLRHVSTTTQPHTTPSLAPNASRRVFSPFPCPRLPPRRVMTRLDDDTATTRTRRVKTRLDDDTGHDEVQDVSRHVSNTPGMRSQGQTTKPCFVVCALGAFFFFFSLSFSSFATRARDTRLEPFFSYFLYHHHHHHQGPRRVSGSGFLFFFFYFLFITKARDTRLEPFFFFFFLLFILCNHETRLV
jgi:hypothetical protein